MIKLSVVIITFNEEQNIARCLDSVKDLADDIVVVDSFSTDNTVNLCKSYGAKVFSLPFEGYVNQKNKADQYAASDYILSLDADEVLSETLIQSIKQVKNNWEKEGYYLSRLNNYCGKWIRHCGWYPDRKLRLFDRRKGEWKGITLHEKFEVEGETGILKGDLLHYTYPTIASHITQTQKFTSIAARELFQQEKKATPFKILFSPVFKFLKSYFVKLGFLDGYQGLMVCSISAWSNYLKYKKLASLRKEKAHV